jgi:succinyl-CoA synthetase beta subunit
MLDRSAAGPIIVASPRGGMAIEDVAHDTPEAITSVVCDLADGPTPVQLSALAAFSEFKGPSAELFKEAVMGLWRMFKATDSTMIEVNPLSETSDGKVFAVDAKINFDDNAAFRQASIFAKRDYSQEDSREVQASKWDLNYIGLDGNIGCMVNGAGLAMATMDIIKLHGGAPANFLDVGGGATAEQVKHAFEILNADPKVKAILVNIFGGIMRCDTIAEGIIKAAKEVGLRVPLVVRLEGTNMAQGRALLNSSGIAVITASDLDEAAMKAVATLKQGSKTAKAKKTA